MINKAQKLFLEWVRGQIDFEDRSREIANDGTFKDPILNVAFRGFVNGGLNALFLTDQQDSELIDGSTLLPAEVRTRMEERAQGVRSIQYTLEDVFLRTKS